MVPVNSSHGQLVTSKQTSKQANIKAVLPQQYNYPYPQSAIATITQKKHKKLSRKQSEQQSTCSFLLTTGAVSRTLRVIV